VEPGANGYLFEPGDVGALRENLKALLLAGANRRQQMGKASLEVIGRQFTEETVMPQIEAAFQQAISLAQSGGIDFRLAERYGQGHD
jgi:glycosyltransferase involved in cell wall biosynthesis